MTARAPRTSALIPARFWLSFHAQLHPWPKGQPHTFNDPGNIFDGSVRRGLDGLATAGGMLVLRKTEILWLKQTTRRAATAQAANETARSGPETVGAQQVVAGLKTNIPTKAKEQICRWPEGSDQHKFTPQSSATSTMTHRATARWACFPTFSWIPPGQNQSRRRATAIPGRITFYLFIILTYTGVCRCFTITHEGAGVTRSISSTMSHSEKSYQHAVGPRT